MKRLCKKIDITDRKFISEAVRDALRNNYTRNDTLTLFEEASRLTKNQVFYMIRRFGKQSANWIIERVIDRVLNAILKWKFDFPPIFYRRKVDGNSGKVRTIGIENIYQQLYEYVVVKGLDDLRKKFGFYQCACIKGRGPHMGARAIKRWLRSEKVRYAWKADAHHYYQNINIDKLKELLKRYVANELLLKLTFMLLDTFQRGLSIGSYLSQFLANFYMSFAYHYAIEQLYKIRKKKDGTAKRVRLINHAIFHMDDILFTSSNLKDIKMAIKKFKKWIQENLDIEIKPDEKIIDLEESYIDMVGFLLSKKKVIVRPRNFRRFRRDVKKTLRSSFLPLHRAKSIAARYGWPKNCDCKHFIKRNKVKKILKLCKEAIKSGKDVVYRTATGSDNCNASGRKA